MKLIDIIGKEVQFKIENSEKYKTTFGGFITIILGIISLISLWFFGSDIIYKQSPSLITKELFLDKPEYHILNNSNYFFAIKFSNIDGNLINDPRIFIPKFMYRLYEMNSTTGSFDLSIDLDFELGNCNSSHIDEYTLQNEFLEFYHCANLNNYTAGGNWDNDKIGTLFFYAEVCNEKTEKEKNITCASLEELKQKYDDVFYIEAKYINSIIDQITPTQSKEH